MEQTQLNIGTRKIDVEIYAPSNQQPVAGILLLHELFGLLDCYREDAADLAERGYLVYLPDLFSGNPIRYCIRAMVTAAGMQNKSSNPLNQEIHDLVDHLKADPRCNGRLGILGACLTGGFVLQMAKRDDMLAPVVYHHSLGLQGSGVPNNESLDNVKVLQGHWAKVDPLCPTSRRNKLQAQLGDRLERYEYNMPHGFRSVSRHLSDSKLVWERTLEFFDKHLVQTTS